MQWPRPATTTPSRGSTRPRPRSASSWRARKCAKTHKLAPSIQGEPEMFRRGLGALVAMLTVTLTAASSSAQDLPTRTVKMIVAFPAGGPTDFVARLLADKLKSLIGQNVIVE